LVAGDLWPEESSLKLLDQVHKEGHQAGRATMEKNREIVVTLTTIPSRALGALPCLESLLAQRYPIYTVELNLPRYCARFGVDYDRSALQGIEELAERSGGKLRVRAVDEDLGPITKLVPTLEAHPDAWIAVCDDDQFYPSTWLSTLARYHTSASGRAVVGPSGLARGRERPMVKVAFPSKPWPVLCPQGYTGYLFDAGLVRGENLRRFFQQVRGWNANATWVDDVVVGAFFDTLGVPRFAVPFAPNARPQALGLGDALHDDDMAYYQAHGQSRHGELIRELLARGLFRGRSPDGARVEGEG
jgi:hypothetical protein